MMWLPGERLFKFRSVVWHSIAMWQTDRQTYGRTYIIWQRSSR